MNVIIIEYTAIVVCIRALAKRVDQKLKIFFLDQTNYLSTALKKSNNQLTVFTFMHESTNTKLICDALRSRRRLSFSYHGKERIGEPQCCGISTAGKLVVRMNLIKGGSRPEQLFEVNLMETLTTLDEHFTRPGPHYKTNDTAFREIYCQLER